jgi:hypothetical protein
LELEVLANNTKAINAYLKAGFVQTSPVIVNGWNQKFSMRQKETSRYAFAAAAVRHHNWRRPSRIAFTKFPPPFFPKTEPPVQPRKAAVAGYVFARR